MSAARVFAVVEPDGDISGVLHLEFTGGGANVGLSVSSWGRNQGIGTLLLQRAGLLACAQGLKTLFVRNLNFNSALQQLALRLGMKVACTPNALIRRTETPEPNGHDVEHDGFCGKIRLVDDSLRSQWDGTSFDAVPFDLQGAELFLGGTSHVGQAARDSLNPDAGSKQALEGGHRLGRADRIFQ